MSDMNIKPANCCHKLSSVVSSQKPNEEFSLKCSGAFTGPQQSTQSDLNSEITKKLRDISKRFISAACMGGVWFPCSRIALNLISENKGCVPPPLSVVNLFLFGGGVSLLFNGLIQDVLLKRLLGKAIKTIAPSHASWIDSRTGKAFRIFCTASVLSITEQGPIHQKLFKFVLMLIPAVMKESSYGLTGTMGYYTGVVASQHLPFVLKC